MSGWRSAGWDREPPIAGLDGDNRSDQGAYMDHCGVPHPIVAPVDHAIGMNAYACAMFVESVISANMLFMTPMLPFKAPLRLRLAIGRNN